MGVTMIDASAEEAIPMQRFMQDLVRDTSLKTDNLRLVNDNSAKSVLDFDRSSSNRGNHRSSTNSSPRLKKKGNLKSSLKKSPKKASNNDLKKKTSHSTLSNMSSTHSAEANDTFDIHSLVLVSDNARVFAKARPKQSRDMLGSASWHSSSEMRKLHTASARWGSNNSNDSSFSHSSMSPPLSARQNKTFSVSRPSVRGGRRQPPVGMMKRQESDSCLVLPKRSSEGPPSMPRRNPPLQNSPPLKFHTPKSEKRRYIGSSSRGSPPPPTTTSEEDNDHDDSSSCSSSTSNSCASFSSVSSVEDDLPARMPEAAPTTTRKANAWAALLGSKTKVRSKAATSAAAYHQPSKPASAPNIFQTAGRRRRTSIVKGPDTAASIFAKNLDSYGPAGLRTDNGVRYSSLPMNLKPKSSSSFSKKSSSSNNNNNNNNTRKPMRHSWNSSRDAIHVPDMLKLPYYDRFVAATSLDSNSSHNSSNSGSDKKDKPMTKPLSSSSLMSLPAMPSSSASPRNNNTGLPAKPMSSSSLMMMKNASNLPYYDRFRATTSLDGPRLPSRASSDSRSPYAAGRRPPPSRSHSASAAVRRSASGGGLARRHNNSMALLSPCPEEQIPSGSGRSLRSIQRQRSGGRSTSTGSRLSTRSKSSSSNSSRHSSTDGLLGDDGSSHHSRSTNYSVNSRHSSRGSGVGIGRTYSGRSSKSNSSSRSSYSHSSNDSSVMSALELALGDMAPTRRNRKKPVGMIATTKSSRHNKN